MAERPGDGILSRQSAPHHDVQGPDWHPVSSDAARQAAGSDLQQPILSHGVSAGVQKLRSCVTCRRRKVRCDKHQPCSNCRRALIPCVPAPPRAPRRRRVKSTDAATQQAGQRDAEVIERLRKLEAIVNELSTQVEVESGGPVAAVPQGSRQQDQASERPATSATTGQPKATDRETGPQEGQREGDDGADGDGGLRQNFGRMVLDDQSGTRRYISSNFWSKLNDQLDELRHETQSLTDDDGDESEYEGTTTDDSPYSGAGSDQHYTFVLGYSVANSGLEKCQPLPGQASLLWSIYLQNVEPLIKVLHVPSADVTLYNARHSPNTIAPANAALAFSIYFAAITSLEADEVMAKFGTNKEELLKQYRFCMEHSLAKARFLDTSEIAVVQALTIFLTVTRKHDESRFCWALTGLLIRVAQGLGLHRDGTLLHLSPFDTEMRRRIWWAILLLDFRSAEALGTDLTVGERSYNTKLPSNINDADISAESTEPPAPRAGKSDTAVAIVRAEICTLSRRLAAFSLDESPALADIQKRTTAEKEKLLLETYRHVDETFLQYVRDDSEPLYWVAAMIARIIMAKNRLVIYQATLFPGSGFERPAEWRLRNYTAAIEVLEYSHELNLNDRYKQFRWLFKTYNNWFIVAYILMETCSRPWSALVERGWEAVNGYEKDPVTVAKRADQAAVFLPLRQLFARARKHREQEKARLMAQHAETVTVGPADGINVVQPQASPSAEMERRNVEDDFRTQPGLDNPGSPAYLFATQESLASAPLVGAGDINLDETATVSTLRPSQRTPGGELVAPAGELMPFGMDWSEASLQSARGFWPSPRPEASQPWNIASGANDAWIVPDAANTVFGLPEPVAEDDALRQQTMMAAQESGDSHVPPDTWGDQFMTNSGMVGDYPLTMWNDFNWQDWSQSLRGLDAEMETPQRPW
ncbi:fungal specific transcription factor domain-containing protein [Purpureocillium lavendulum]|uniref:Fungal specific transcription factor domain-containing protein n=1 Tax=Purpureocillium lavendulum TaxID=1247861 RepID=A0AB34FQD2_9HYPO|nr:fungal specific transcription factor domain-containing protein [Purpureocillium lavendulum]